MRAAQVLWTKVHEDLLLGIDDGARTGDLSEANASALRNEASRLNESVVSGDRGSLRSADWTALEPWAARGIQSQTIARTLSDLDATTEYGRVTNFRRLIAMIGVHKVPAPGADTPEWVARDLDLAKHNMPREQLGMPLLDHYPSSTPKGNAVVGQTFEDKINAARGIASDARPNAAPTGSAARPVEPQAEWYDLRFVTRDPDAPIRMMGPEGQSILDRTRTGLREFGYLVPVGDDGTLNFRLHAHTFYLPPNGTIAETINFGQSLATDLLNQFYYRLDGKTYNALEQYHEGMHGRFLNVHGTPVEVSFGTSDPSIMTVARARDTADTLTFKRTGQVRLLVQVGDEMVARIPLGVVTSPVRVGMTNEELLKSVGFPTDEEKAYAEWPRGMSLNRRYYEPSARERIIAIRHVRYEKFPELVVGLDREGRVRSIHSNTEHTRVR